MSLKHINNPVLFQGNLKKKNYFEGWYFKHVRANGKYTIAFIPGVSLDWADSHSFVQVIVSTDSTVETYYFRYPVEAFKAVDSPFSVTVGASVFTLKGSRIDLDGGDQDPSMGISFKGDLDYSGLRPIEVSKWMPNIMGFFAYIPNMECNHGVISMGHSINGHIDIMQLGAIETIEIIETIDFNGGRGYLEKDWGTSFPSAYIWIQANHFEDPSIGFMASIATIPLGLFKFRGLIANLQVGAREYRFATYNLAKVKNLASEPNRVAFELVKGHVSLTCEAVLAEAGALKAPQRGEMIRTIKEGLSGQVTLTLKRRGQPPLVMKSSHAGIEIVWS